MVMLLNEKQTTSGLPLGQDGDGAEREAESPRAATKDKKYENESMRLVEGLTEPWRILQGMPSDVEAAIQVLEPPKHLPEHFRLRASHAVFDHSMLEGHTQQIDRNRSSFCNPFTCRTGMDNQ